MPAEPEAGDTTAPKKARTWLWWVAAWFLWTFVADEILEAVLDWMVAAYDYVTRAQAGLCLGWGAAALGIVVLAGARPRRRRAPDPEA
ncbi:hypothetical protein AVL61_06135 [Kocuria rosea subsp. polaris]|uniref:Uncharacterized protein n=1 Tax=Kocuria rosea subsp. polaris TaxID=136273 RepID=A0A0W8I9M6_KOCRO|nr:hypothetical protein [Kocuria polaris]KUG56633.1 hypothetical protein AVL61_06135 [Kocuria polaris]